MNSAAVAALSETQLRAAIENVLDVLWPDGDPDFEWDDETIELVAGVLARAGLRPVAAPAVDEERARDDAAERETPVSEMTDAQLRDAIGSRRPEAVEGDYDAAEKYPVGDEPEPPDDAGAPDLDPEVDAPDYGTSDYDPADDIFAGTAQDDCFGGDD